MTFLNAILLGGMAAASIPIIIHLINRNRFRVVKWGAMHLLESALRENTRRLRIEQLILLLIRCLIPILLALALARPVLKGAEALLGQSKSSHVVVLDNSYSMDFGGNVSGNFVQARQQSEKILEAMGRGSDAAIVLMAGGVSTLMDAPTFDRARLTRELMGLDAGYGRADVVQSLEHAAAVAANMQHPHREIVVVSDFQRVSWSGEDGAARQRAMDLIGQSEFPPRVTLFHVGEEGRDNVSVESLDFTQLVLGVGQPMRVRANLRNFGDRSYSALRVYFRVDGKERSASQIALDPGEQKQLLFTHTFKEGGSHVIEVSAEADPLAADNSMQASIPVWDRVPVLLVNGASSPEPLKGETDFLEIALQPFGQARVELADLISTRVIPPEQLDMKALEQVRVAVLANVTRLDDAQRKAVATFVRDGGGLLVFPGDRVDADWYRQTMWADGGGLLPAPLLEVSGARDEAAEPGHILPGHYSHTALELFNDPSNGNLSDAEIRMWYKLPPPPAGVSSVSVLARLGNGDPFLMERSFGEGRVILCATAADGDWSNLPLRPFYLPLMQRLVTYLASTVYPPRNVGVGQPLVAILPGEAAGRNATVLDPSGRQHKVPVLGRERRAIAEFTGTARPGMYLMTLPDGDPLHFVVSTSREESDLEQLTSSERESLAQSMNATIVRSFEEYEDLERTRRFGKEIWQAVFWALLGLIVLEVYLEQRFSDRRG